MRKTGKEILDLKVPDDACHTWLAEATLEEVYEFLRWAPALGSWASHGRDRLNVLLANENIKLQTEIRDLTAKMKKMTQWVIGLTIVIAFLTLLQAYSGIKTFYNDIKSLRDTPKTENNTNQKPDTNQLKNSNNKSLNKAKIINHKVKNLLTRRFTGLPIDLATSEFSS
ncbi:MAG: hypothetical protein FJ130_04145 [Deltaproteobacteria bacterium]|nr:hypothetical protein [Deltaproteobacteria bacterium]